MYGHPNDQHREGNTMRSKLPLAAIAAIFVSTGSALAVDSTLITTSSLSPDALWKKVGEFCGIGSWHPAIEKCVLSEDGKQRTLSLRGGGTIVEALEIWDNANHTYGYKILSSPLPVTNYHSTISVVPEGKGSALKWMGTYDSQGASEAEAKKVIDGIYESGSKALTGS
jgi:hypothetical protein